VKGSPLREYRGEELDEVERVQFTRMYHLREFMYLMRWRALVEARVAEYPNFEPEPIRNDFRCGLN